MQPKEVEVALTMMKMDGQIKMMPSSKMRLNGKILMMMALETIQMEIIPTPAHLNGVILVRIEMHALMMMVMDTQIPIYFGLN